MIYIWALNPDISFHNLGLIKSNCCFFINNLINHTQTVFVGSMSFILPLESIESMYVCYVWACDFEWTCFTCRVKSCALTCDLLAVCYWVMELYSILVNLLQIQSSVCLGVEYKDLFSLGLLLKVASHNVPSKPAPLLLL